MELILHRRNTAAELLATPRQYGVEVDIRSWGRDLIVHHDPFVEGERLDTWLAAFSHGRLVLNVKEEGLEERLLSLMHHYDVTDFFFLDQSFPFLYRTAKRGEKRCAVRVSEFEDVRTALRMADMVEWAWVDCFTHFALSAKDAESMTRAGLKLCLVSPELLGRDAQTQVADLRRLLGERAIKPAAVCTKRPDLWI